MKSQDPTFPLYPVLAFIGFVLSLIPLPWHIQAWNSGTCAFMIWTATMCLIYAVNSIVWEGNVLNTAPVWCDITSKLMIGVSAGIPASLLCISRRLYHITAVQTVSVTRDDKLRMVLIDLCISAGIPVLVMILHVVVQGHRYDILEDFGCLATTYNTLPAYFLVYMWPILLGAISLVYSTLTLRSFWIRRAQFHDLVSSNSALSLSRYLRLMLLAFLDILFTLPLAIYTVYLGTRGPLQPWISWSDTHYGFDRILQVPALLWKSNTQTHISIELTRWLPLLCAFLFFGLFGFASEAQKQYARVFNALANIVGYKRQTTPKKASLPSWVRPLKTSSSASVGTSPVYIPRAPQKKGIYSPSSTDVDQYSVTDVEKSAGFSTADFTSSPPEYDLSPLTELFSPAPSTTAASFFSSIPPTPSTFSMPPSPTVSDYRISASISQAYLEAHAAAAAGDISLPSSRSSSPSIPPSSPANPPPADHPTRVQPGLPSPPYHRPFSPPSVYPAAQPHPRAAPGGICITIHRQDSVDEIA